MIINLQKIIGFTEQSHDRMAPPGDAWCCLQRSAAFSAWHGPRRSTDLGRLGDVGPEFRAKIMGNIWENMGKYGKIWENMGKLRFSAMNFVMMMIIFVDFFSQTFSEKPT